nr:hypothetical protein Iba_chr04eCG4870 [Ipomoea batatas]
MLYSPLPLYTSFEGIFVPQIILILSSALHTVLLFPYESADQTSSASADATSSNPTPSNPAKTAGTINPGIDLECGPWCAGICNRCTNGPAKYEFTHAISYGKTKQTLPDYLLLSPKVSKGV